MIPSSVSLFSPEAIYYIACSSHELMSATMRCCGVFKLLKKNQRIKFDTVKDLGKPTGLASYHIWSYQIVRIESLLSYCYTRLLRMRKR